MKDIPFCQRNWLPALPYSIGQPGIAASISAMSRMTREAR